MGQTHEKSRSHFHAENARGNRLVDQNHHTYANVLTNSSVNTDLNVSQGGSFFTADIKVSTNMIICTVCIIIDNVLIVKSKITPVRFI